MAVDRHTCAECGKHYVVPSLARWCEARHRREDGRVVEL